MANDTIIWVNTPAVVQKQAKARASIVYGKYRFFFKTRIQQAQIIGFVKYCKSGFPLETALRNGDILRLRLPNYILAALGVRV